MSCPSSMTCDFVFSDDLPTEAKAPLAEKKKGRKGRRRTTDNKPLLHILSIMPVKDALTVTCALDTGKATITFDFDYNHNTADDIINNLVSNRYSQIIKNNLL